jgi:tyrosine-protein kinase Etk/Wzc
MSTKAIGLSVILIRLASYRWLLTLMPMSLAILVGVKSALSPPIFTAYASMLPPQTNTATASSVLNQVGGTAVLGAAALTLKNPSDLYASLFKSRSVQDTVIKRFDLASHYDKDDLDDLRAEVDKRTKVEVGKDGIISLAYTDKTAQGAADIANAMIDAMYDIARRLSRDEANRRLDFYDSMIAQAREKLEESDRKLMELERKTGLTRLKGQEEASTSVMVELRGMIATREVELQKMLTSATERHPDIIRFRNELNGLRTQLAQAERSKVQRNGTNGDIDPDRIRRKQDNLLLTFEDYSELRTLAEPMRREVEINKNMVEQLVRGRELSRVDESRDLSIIQVLDTAVAPTKKSGPKVVLNAIIGGVLGGILAVIFALSWDILFTDNDRRARWRHVIRSFLRLRLQEAKADEVGLTRNTFKRLMGIDWLSSRIPFQRIKQVALWPLFQLTKLLRLDRVWTHLRRGKNNSA